MYLNSRNENHRIFDVPVVIFTYIYILYIVIVVTDTSSSSGVNLLWNIHPAAFLAVPAVLCILLITLIVYFFWRKMKTSQKKRREKERIRNYLGDNLSAQPLTEDSSIEVRVILAGQHRSEVISASESDL